jgi:hypothetical protein
MDIPIHDRFDVIVALATLALFSLIAWITHTILKKREARNKKE